MKKVCITGATGFLGGYVTKKLLEESFDVSAIVRRAGRCEKNVREITADLTDLTAMQAIRSDICDMEILVHLAAEMPQASTSLQEQEVVQGKQIKAIENLLPLLGKSLKHIVYASSIDVFGKPLSIPINEDHPTNPITAYGRAKLASEILLKEFCTQYGCTLTILRITHIYGCGEPVIKAIPHFMKKIASGEPPQLYGDGEDLRDYIEVSDAARAVLLAVHARKNDTCIIASGKSTTLRSILENIIQLSGKNLKAEFRERQKPRIDFRFDVSKAKNILGFEARVPLSQGLKMQYNETLHS